MASLKARPSLSCRVAVGRTEDAAVTAAGSTALLPGPLTWQTLASGADSNTATNFSSLNKIIAFKVPFVPIKSKSKIQVKSFLAARAAQYTISCSVRSSVSLSVC